MAFRLGSPGSTGFGINAGGPINPQAQVGPELEEIQTEALGFQSIAGEAKLRLLPAPWPTDALPPPTASLLSVAPQNGLLAAAGPTSVVIARTEAVRKAFATGDGPDDKVRAFTPQLTLDLGMRVSQVAFTADEKYLILSAERGGGLAVYEVQNLIQGNSQSAFEISTQDTPLRMLLPNPTPEKAELLAAVTVKGELLMANLTSRQFMSGPQGLVLKDGVSCVSWSTKGKQLVAGLGDGSCYQLTPEGESKDSIPQPPDLEVNQHVSAITWLENALFLIAYTTTSGNEDMIPATTFRLVTRQSKPQVSHIFQKLPEACAPFGMHRFPPYHFMQRLRGFPPSLTDLIVVTSTASADVGLFTRADTPLTSDVEPEKITKTFTTTTMANDTRRAQLPIDENFNDTSPIGMAIDLSATEKVPRPLPGEEMDESEGPLPLVMILNNEGLLTGWWVVYAESVRQRTTYPGLVAAGGFRNQAQAAKSTSPFATATTQNAASPLNSNTFGSPPAPAATNNVFGNPGSNNAFGASSALGSKPSVWGSATSASPQPETSGATFGQPAFGSTSHLGGNMGGAAFGAPGGIGSRPSPWGTPASGLQTAGATFGQPASLGMGAGSAFGTSVAPKPFGADSSSGFASFAKKPGFAEAAAAAKPAGESPFAKLGGGATFGSGMDTDSAFGAPFKKPGEDASNIFGGNAYGGQFKLGSTFKGDGTSSTDAPKPAATTHDSLFGGDFVSNLGETQKQPDAPVSKEADMDEGGSGSEREAMSEASEDDQVSATPADKPKASLFGFQQTNPPIAGGLFGTQAQSKTTPASVQTSVPATFSFGKPQPVSTTPEDTPRKPDEPVRPSIETSSPVVKQEPQDESPSGIRSNISQGPLPPDTTSKDSYSPGDTSQSSASGSKLSSNDAPLPPDFMPSKAKPQAPRPGSHPDSEEDEEEPALPEDDDSGLDDEGSGIDVAQEISSETDPTRTPKFTPGSSFGMPLDRTPESVFSAKGPSKGPSDSQLKPQSLFGEVSKPSNFVFPPPTRTQQSPRSPSPVRSHLAVGGLRPDNARSVSAPDTTAKKVPSRKIGSKLSNPLAEAQPSIAEIQRQHQDQLAAQRAKYAVEEEQPVLIDDEEDRIAELLNSEVEPTKELLDLIAHEDYGKTESENGLPAQIEILYRDINSMIHTIGLNARSLESFIRGHSELGEGDHRSLADLKEPGWCLGEIDQLKRIENEISKLVSSNRISDMGGKLAECEGLGKDLKRLRDRQRDISSVLRARSDHNETEELRYAQLPVDQAAKQKELRTAFKRVQELTAEAERKVFELRTDLAARDASSSNVRSMKKPTVKAVTDTIYKMTSMVQQHSTNIDVLEAKMRKLRIPAAANSSSREDSPFAASTSLAPPSDQADALSKSMGGLRLAVNGNGAPHRQSRRITQEQLDKYRAKVQRRKEMNELVKEVWRSEGPIIRPLD